MKTVLITGATIGIGAATARLLLDNGHNVAVTGRNNDKLRAFVDATGRSVSPSRTPTRALSSEPPNR
jgi:NADP-dependent 3-hydroxy acid dehydrogenase YdfG